MLVDQIAALLSAAKPPVTLGARARERLVAAMPGLKERAKTLVELAKAADFLFSDGPRVLDAAAEKILDDDARATLADILPLLSAGPWSATDIEARVRAFAEARGLKLGQAAQPIRAAVTGRATSPPVFDVLAVLGPEEALARLSAYAAERNP